MYSYIGYKYQIQIHQVYALKALYENPIRKNTIFRYVYIYIYEIDLTSYIIYTRCLTIVSSGEFNQFCTASAFRYTLYLKSKVCCVMEKSLFFHKLENIRGVISRYLFFRTQ